MGICWENPKNKQYTSIYFCNILQKKSLKMPNAVNWRRTNNTMAK